MKSRCNRPPPILPTGAAGAVESPSEALRQAGFTLLELLVVIGIVGILAAIATPTLNSFKPDVKASATRQLLDDISHARQLAIGQRTTVYMVFVPTNFWSDPAVSTWTPKDWVQATNLMDKQTIGYTFVTLRSVGDQPGQHTPHYLSAWRTLPEGAFIPLAKFYHPGIPNMDVPVITIETNVPAAGGPDISVYRFKTTTDVPFPSETAPKSTDPNAPYVRLPYLAFNYQGQLLTSLQRDEAIPLAKGTVGFSRDPVAKTPKAVSAALAESPVGNTTNMYNVINIDWLTGRARVQRLEVR